MEDLACCCRCTITLVYELVFTGNIVALKYFERTNFGSTLKEEIMEKGEEIWALLDSSVAYCSW